MTPYIKLSLNQEVHCTINGEAVPNQKYPGSYQYQVLVNNVAHILNASATMHSKIQSLKPSFGTQFSVKQEAIPGGKTMNKIFDNEMVEVGAKTFFATPPQKQPTRSDPLQQANIEAQWALGRAIDALYLYKKEGNQVSETPDEIIKAQAKKFIQYKNELAQWIVQNNTNKN